MVFQVYFGYKITSTREVTDNSHFVVFLFLIVSTFMLIVACTKFLSWMLKDDQITRQRLVAGQTLNLYSSIMMEVYTLLHVVMIEWAMSTYVKLGLWYAISIGLNYYWLKAVRAFAGEKK